jgi:hypothetical protein
MAMIVMGKPGVGKVWIHYCVGDSKGNNRWLGHFNRSGNLNYPYQDCNCQMWDMDKPTATCQYITRQDYLAQKIQIEACTNESAKRDVCKEFSKHNIVNVCMHEDLSLFDQLHGIYHMTSPEQLHTTSEDLTKYTIDSLCNTISNVGDGKKLLTKTENLHHTLHFDLKKNSEHDFPRRSARNGALNDTLVSTTEHHGNMFLLLCLCHTNAVCKDFEKILCQSRINSANFFKCLELYISMEEWFQENNLNKEVNLANSLVAEILDLLHTFFPQWDKDSNKEGQKWSVSKFHGVSKFVLHIKLFGNAINFYGGIGEYNHKKFVKETG